MSIQLASIVPIAPLTDPVFSFNAKHILEIREYQQQDLHFLTLQPVRDVLAITGAVGDTATGITRGVGTVAKSTVGDVGKIFRGSLFGGGILLGGASRLAEHVATGAIDLAEHTAERLVDPTKVVRTHLNYSNNIHDHLPAAIKAVDVSIKEFGQELEAHCLEMYENIPTKGVQILVNLENRLTVVAAALAKMEEVLTQNHVLEEMQIGINKYPGVLGIIGHGVERVFLRDLADRLPLVLKTIKDVQGAFVIIGANIKLAKEKIRIGVTEPKYIFAESAEEVRDAWHAYEAKRKTLTYEI